MTAYYNENDPQAAEWLRELIKNGLIAKGDVDERDIRDISPSDLGGYTQCHFFAGIGGWSYALRLAEWPDDRPVWTGSCPCQPFSTAGRGKGVADERHLWPHFHWLIEQCQPPIVFGEQVASKDGLAWLDLVQTDLEGAGYAFGAADLCAAGVGAPHIRQRLYWVANAEVRGCQQRIVGNKTQTERASYSCGENERSWGYDSAHGSATVRLADAERQQRQECLSRPGQSDRPQESRASVKPARLCGDDWLADTGRPCPTNGFWRDADWLFCRDGKWRPAQSGLKPLAHGIPSRVGRLRGYGNAIVPQVAQTFIEAYLEAV